MNPLTNKSYFVLELLYTVNRGKKYKILYYLSPINNLKSVDIIDRGIRRRNYCATNYSLIYDQRVRRKNSANISGRKQRHCIILKNIVENLGAAFVYGLRMSTLLVYLNIEGHLRAIL